MTPWICWLAVAALRRKAEEYRLKEQQQILQSIFQQLASTEGKEAKKHHRQHRDAQLSRLQKIYPSVIPPPAVVYFGISLSFTPLSIMSILPLLLFSFPN